MRNWRMIAADAGVSYTQNDPHDIDTASMTRKPGWANVPALMACALEVLMDLRKLLHEGAATRRDLVEAHALAREAHALAARLGGRVEERDAEIARLRDALSFYTGDQDCGIRARAAISHADARGLKGTES
jgi:hypothetical protein